MYRRPERHLMERTRKTQPFKRSRTRAATMVAPAVLERKQLELQKLWCAFRLRLLFVPLC